MLGVVSLCCNFVCACRTHVFLAEYLGNYFPLDLVLLAEHCVVQFELRLFDAHLMHCLPALVSFVFAAESEHQPLRH